MSADRPDSNRPTPSQNRNERPGDDEGSDSKPRSPSFLALALVVIGFMLLVQFFRSGERSGTEVPYSFFLRQLDAGNVKSVKIGNPIINGEWKAIPAEKPSSVDSELTDGFNTVMPVVEDRQVLNDLMKSKDVEVAAKDQSVGMWDQFLLWMLPLFIMMGFLFWIMRRSSDPMGSGMFGSFVRSPAKRFKASEQQNTFSDVAGMEHAKRELEEVVEFLKDPEKFQRLGAQIPKGVLLMGPPGTGKTLLARATAGEAGVPFFSINGSEFIQMFVGVGASRVRDMFRTAKDAAPSILFIDEIDAVGRIRGAGVGGGHDEREQTLNQILSEMDGFQQSEAVIVIAATNRPDVLDPALLRPGRFDRHVAVEKPTKAGRLGILKVHTRKVPLADNVKLDEIAAGTIGFSGADLKNLVNEAALNATREGKNAVDKDDFEWARDRILMGAKREELINVHEREMTAYHEAGHALLAWLSPEIDLVHKVTIVPRGRALGVTQLLPEEDRLSIGEKRLYAMLAFMLGGRGAEKLQFDEYTAGAEDDLRRATDITRRMVANWGMSEKIGPVAFRQGEEHPFLGKEMHEQRQFSEETARLIDEEIQRILAQAQREANETLTANRDKLEMLAQGLLKDEILDREEMTALIGPPVERRYKPMQPV
ncbi:MAG: ATP-dependent zinc metalloprotease FtsH [Planctomycetaceae bacterium]